jgi:redox-sensitive bicupin YhaK (pirin superfamily)
MSTVRKIKKLMKAVPTLEGAGVHLKRVFGYHQVPELDPFLLLDDFHSDDPDKYLPGFPWHPHRGIETITYLLEGEVEHGDSMGNKGVIGEGDVQWMTAGSGIVHQEMPKGSSGGTLWGFQLWANLPASHKMMDPRYRDVTSGTIPEAAPAEGVTARVISGEIGGVRGPVTDIVTDPSYFDVSIDPGTSWKHEVEPGYTVIAYVIAGKGYFGPERDSYEYDIEGANWFDIERECMVGPETLVLYRDGGRLEITTEGEGVRFLLMSGRPIGEPVAWYGPIVMNTKEELKTAFDEYRDGTFLKHD